MGVGVGWLSGLGVVQCGVSCGLRVFLALGVGVLVVAFCVAGVLDVGWVGGSLDRAGSAVCLVWLVLFEGVFFLGAVWAWGLVVDLQGHSVGVWACGADAGVGLGVGLGNVGVASGSCESAARGVRRVGGALGQAGAGGALGAGAGSGQCGAISGCGVACGLGLAGCHSLGLDVASLQVSHAMHGSHGVSIAGLSGYAFLQVTPSAAFVWASGQSVPVLGMVLLPVLGSLWVLLGVSLVLQLVHRASSVGS